MKKVVGLDGLRCFLSFGLIGDYFLTFHRQRPKDVPQKYIKAVYREYTDSTYTAPKPRPTWTGRSSGMVCTDLSVSKHIQTDGAGAEMQ